MKQKITSLILVLFALFLPAITLQAQSSSQYGINYQAVARDASGNPLAEKDITVVLGILDPNNGNALLWEETHKPQTSSLGLFTLVLGRDEENRTGGEVKSFEEIPWNNGPLYLKVSIELDNETIELEPEPIEAVPYALYGRDEDADASNELQGLRLSNGLLSLTGNPDEANVNMNSYLSEQVGWVRDADTVYYIDGSVGVGTVSPESLLEVKSKIAGDEPIFQVKNDQGVPVFAVYNEGVEINIPEVEAKGAKSGFAVGGYNNQNKVLPVDEYFFQIKPEGANINFLTDAGSKGIKSGFAVGGYNTSKTDPSSYVYMDPYAVPYTYDDGLYIPIFETTVPKGNCYVGTMAGQLRKGQFNTSVGYQSGYSMSAGFSGYPLLFLSAAKYNTTMGAFSGFSNIYGDYNIYLGYQAGYSNTSSSNVFIGYRAGYSNTGSGNVFIGTNAGYDELGSNKLYIANSGTTNPLLYGDFNSGTLKINGNFAVNRDPISGYGMIVDTPTSQTESYALWVRGNTYISGTLYESSDKSLKTDIRRLTSPLENLKQIEGVSFTWTDTKLADGGIQLGVIAQDLKQVYPELVREDHEGHLAVNYSGLIPVLIEAVKVQQQTIEQLEKTVQEQKAQILQLENAKGSSQPANGELLESIEKLNERITQLENSLNEKQ